MWLFHFKSLKLGFLIEECMISLFGWEVFEEIFELAKLTSYLMNGCVRSGDLAGVFGLFDELKEKLGGFVENGVVYGPLVKGYFMKGMEKEAMQFYEEAVGEGSKVKMSAVEFNSSLDALNKNGKFELGLRLFDKMIEENRPLWCLTVNLGSFNVMVDGYCVQERFKDAIEVFRKMGEYRCSPDTLSFNNLIEQLCDNGMLGEAEEVYGEMSEKGVNLDEFKFVLLMDACFKADRADDAARHYRKMVESGLRPNLGVYNKLVDGLVKVGKVDDAKSFFDLMVKKLKMDVASYEFIMKALTEVGKLDEVLNVVDTMLDDDGVELTEELQEFVKGELRKEGREEDLGKLIDEKERQKAEAAEAAMRSARATVASLQTFVWGGKKMISSFGFLVFSVTCYVLTFCSEKEKRNLSAYLFCWQSSYTSIILFKFYKFVSFAI